MKIGRTLLFLFLAVYLAPALASAGYWSLLDRPGSWREADWSSAGILPHPDDERQATIHVFSAATGGMKGAFASHSWIVTKEENAARYQRYDKVGWGSPVRRNGYPADAFWYSNAPRAVLSLKGAEAARLIPKVEAAIAAYPFAQPGGYRIWPGPNSNTFVAHVLKSVPELGAVLPPDAVGRDYLPFGTFVEIDPDGRDLHASLLGLVGFSAGLRSGLEFHLAGLVAGIDVMRPGVKIPALGRIGM
ncbi:DUF3750 domain-containing protein [Mycoplana sp. MJR14]|uniref:DUF3750 domain-containing protein n=1 Tax=Mycoplana sp. MJR14 TaxID=3032583 RepID=UPI0023DC63C9|nr:DUF3750 domain-containing protein [Mycoplana sp. MJR14]MDF1632129.1 DUF3750 domain-containing protein [Mycoplana sp. MJR14]